MRSVQRCAVKMVFMKMLSGSILIILSGFLFAGCSTSSVKPCVQDVRRDVLKDIYSVRRAVGPIQIDGRLTESCWNTALPARMLLPGSLKKPLTSVDARMLWDDEALYVGYRVMDNDVYATFTERDAPTWEQDVVELFFCTDTVPGPHYEFEFSPRGTIYDSLTGGRDAGLCWRWSPWNCQGMIVAAQIDGTINDWQDRDAGYTVEVRIPFADLPTLKGRAPHAGDEWIFNLAGYNYSVYLSAGRELFCSAPVVKNFNEFELWPKMRFEAAPRHTEGCILK
jgi:hypothetical protein